MVTAQAKRAQQTDPRRVRVVDAAGLPRWSEVWNGNPRLAGVGERGDFQSLQNAPRARPYIAALVGQKWVWREYECEPGEIYLTAQEKAFGDRHRPQIVIEPTIKKGASPNKQWPLDRWRALVSMAGGYSLYQLGPEGTRALPGVGLIRTADFRSACAVMANASLYVGHEGGLHHVAAAFGIPAIVIRGAFISPRVTGYAGQVDFYEGDGLGCGMRTPCPCCAAAMRKIEPSAVFEAIKSVLH